MSPAPENIATADRILEGIYKRTSAWLMEKYELVPARQVPTLSSFEYTQSGLAFAVNRGFEIIDRSDVIVVGGGCLGYCEGQIERLGFEVVADIMYPFCLARWLQTDCLLYLNVTEEVMVSKGRVPESFWTQLGDILQRFARRLAQILEIERLHVLRTDIPKVNLAIEEAVVLWSTHLEANSIDTLYAIDSSGRSSRRDNTRISQYRRNLVSYLPSVIRTGIGVPSTHIVAAENIHQVKAINKARSILSSEIPSSVDRLNHVVCVSPPSITGSKRMSMASSKSAIYILDELDEVKRKMDVMSPSSKYYWNSIWPRVLPSKLLGQQGSSLLDLFAEIQKIFKSCMSQVDPKHTSG